MNTPPLPSEEVPPPPVLARDDAYDDTYDWVGYESAQPQSFSGADLAAWVGSAQG